MGLWSPPPGPPRQPLFCFPQWGPQGNFFRQNTLMSELWGLWGPLPTWDGVKSQFQYPSTDAGSLRACLLGPPVLSQPRRAVPESGQVPSLPGGDHHSPMLLPATPGASPPSPSPPPLVGSTGSALLAAPALRGAGGGAVASGGCAGATLPITTPTVTIATTPTRVHASADQSPGQIQGLRAHPLPQRRAWRAGTWGGHPMDRTRGSFLESGWGGARAQVRSSSPILIPPTD